jgi:hypothetical protein
MMRAVIVGGAGSSSALIGRICVACVDSLPVSGASVAAVLGEGQRGTVYATNNVVARIEDLQFELGEGPGADALKDGFPVLVSDLGDAAGEAAARWPAFTPAARDAGARSVFAFPLLLGAAQIGLLGMYRDAALTLNVPEHARAIRLANAAMYAMLDLFDESGAGTATESPIDVGEAGGDAMFFRAKVYQASGMLSVQLGITIEEAVARLRAYAFAHGQSVTDVAAQIVARKLRLEADNG